MGDSSSIITMEAPMSINQIHMFGKFDIAVDDESINYFRFVVKFLWKTEKRDVPPNFLSVGKTSGVAK